MHGSHYRRLRFRRNALLLGTAPALLVSTAFLAANFVPVTYAGVTEVSVQIPTHLEATPASVNRPGQGPSYHFQGMSARLSANGVHLAGRTIQFHVQNVVVCTGVTNQGGVANCSGPPAGIPATTFASGPDLYTAKFLGRGPLQGSADSQPLS